AGCARIPHDTPRLPTLDTIGKPAYVPGASFEVMDMTARLHTVGMITELQPSLSSSDALVAFGARLYSYSSGR
ncbi:MAG TPA: hypothetical protein VK034_12255, partial [Enhygromyxa sp.]|nr:hypothetical protein [Enhygromyxa sp.]